MIKTSEDYWNTIQTPAPPLFVYDRRVLETETRTSTCPRRRNVKGCIQRCLRRWSALASIKWLLGPSSIASIAKQCEFSAIRQSTVQWSVWYQIDSFLQVTSFWSSDGWVWTKPSDNPSYQDECDVTDVVEKNMFHARLAWAQKSIWEKSAMLLMTHGIVSSSKS